MTVIIPFPPPGLNEYIEAERRNRYKGADLKRKWQKSVALALRRQMRGPLREPVTMHYTWYERDRRRDKDNISAFGQKVIQDAMVRDLHALKNDGWENIFHHDVTHRRLMRKAFRFCDNGGNYGQRASYDVG